MISRKDFKEPGSGHRVCSKHFEGGCKTYMNNVPTIVLKIKNATKRKERPTSKARNRTFTPPDCRQKSEEQNKFMTDKDGKGESEVAEQPSGDSVTEELESQIKDLDLEKSKDRGVEEELRKRVKELESENEYLEEGIQTSADKVAPNFSVENVKSNPKAFKFYTGLIDYVIFKIIFDSFVPALNNLIYHGTQNNPNNADSPGYQKRGPKRIFTAEQEFFLVLVRLRLGLLEEDIAFRTGISTSHFSRIWITWLDFLHSKFRTYPIWPSKAAVIRTMPKCFKEVYPTTRVTIDCTEIYVEKPNSVRSQTATFSKYKHFNTAKGHIGITPAGSVSFVSDLFTGRTSDKVATRECGIYEFLESGDSVIADKGFDIEDDLPNSVSLNIPPFLRGKEYLTIKEETETRKIAAVRIHVEWAISRIKTLKILKSVFPISMGPEPNKIWVVCSYLTNFLPPLIVQDER